MKKSFVTTLSAFGPNLKVSLKRSSSPTLEGQNKRILDLKGEVYMTI